MTPPWRVGLHSKKPRIWVDFKYDPLVIDKIKALPGCRWDASDKLWLLPLDMHTAQELRKLSRQLNTTLSVEPELARWAKEEKNRASRIAPPDDISIGVSHLLPRCRQNHPQLIAAMEKMPWQIPGANFIYEQKRVILADQPGLGKTVQILAAMMEADIQGPILIVAPRSAVAVTWPDEIEKWLGPNEIKFKINTELPPQTRVEILKKIINDFQNQRVWIICGPNYLRIRAELDEYGNYKRDARKKKIIRVINEAIPELFYFKWAGIIVDESQDSLACNRGDRKKWSAQRLGLSALETVPNGYKIAVSGTPFRGKAENLWGTLNWLYPDKYTSIWNWYKRHYGVIDSFIPGGVSTVKGDSIIDEAKFYKELKPIMIRRTKSEVKKDLPPKQYGGTHLEPADATTPIAVWLPMTKRQEKQYRQIVTDALLSFDLDELPINGALAEMVRFKQIANSCLNVKDGSAFPIKPSNKADWIIDFLKERKEAEIKVIVASQFTKFLEMLSLEMNTAKIGHYLYTGKTSDKERATIRKQFQSNKGEMFILLNIKSGGTSLTLDAADDVVICDQTWNPDDLTQVEDRAHRISRIHNVTIWNLASLGTIDEDIAVINQNRDFEVSLIDRQRGVNNIKQLIAATKRRAKVI